MNQLNAIAQYLQDVAGAPIAWICYSCMNEILDDEEQATSIDFGTIRIEEDPAKCVIKHLIDGHEYQN